MLRYTKRAPCDNFFENLNSKLVGSGSTENIFSLGFSFSIYLVVMMDIKTTSSRLGIELANSFFLTQETRVSFRVDCLI